MKRILDDSLFEVFLRKNCEELLEEYRERAQSDSCPLEERLENWFVLGYTCVLCKYSSVRTWLGMLENVNLDGNEDLETVRSIAVHFLGAHLDRMRLNFSKPLLAGSEHNLAEGFYQAVKTGRSVLAVLFLHLAGWHYAVLGMKDVSAALFSLGIRLSRFRSLHPVCVEFCQSGISALEGMEADSKWGAWTSYIYREMCLSLARFPLDSGEDVNHVEEADDERYAHLFGRLSHESFLDLLEKGNGFLDRNSPLDEHSPNELLYAKLKIGRDISAHELDIDSFFVAGPAIDRYYATRALQEKQRSQFVQVFSDFLKQDEFQLRLEMSPNLLRDSLSSLFLSFQERGTDSGEDLLKLIMKMGSGTLYSRVSQDFNEPLRKAGVIAERVLDYPEMWVREAYRKCLSNLDALAMADTKPSLPAEWRLNLLAHLLQRTGNEKYATSLAECIRNSPQMKAQPDVISVFAPYDIRLGEIEGSPLISHASLRSVGVERYIDNPEYGKSLESFLSSFDGENESNKLGLYQFERLSPHIDLLESDGWKGKTSLLEGREIYQMDSAESHITIVFYFFAQEGEWKEIHSGSRWENVSSPGYTIPSPVQQLNYYVESELGYVKDSVVKVLVPFSGVFFYQPAVFLLGLKDVLVVPLKQMLELVGASMGPDTPTFDTLLASFRLDPELLRNTLTGKTNEPNWDFLHLILFCRDHPLLRVDLKSDVRTIAEEYEMVSIFGPTVLLKDFISEYCREFPLPDSPVVFSYCCTMPDHPYSLVVEIHVDGIETRIVDFRFEEHSRLVGLSDGLNCLLAGTLLDVGMSFAKFHHDIRIIGPSDYLKGVFVSEEEEASLFSDRQRVKTVGRVFKTVVSRYQRILQEWQGNQEKLVTSFQIRRFAEASARTAIMARNMSHNLGSHVMAYIKQHLASVSDMLRNSVFDQLFKSKEELERLLNDPLGWRDTLRIERNISSIESVTLPFLVGLGRFMSYLQERQDFIASVATDYIPPCSSLNFKDFIFDELNPDKRYKRHSDRKGEKPDNILLGNIARSEGLMRDTCPTMGESPSEQDIVLSFREFDGEPVNEVPGNVLWNPSVYYGESLKAAKDALDVMRDIYLSVPGGITGRHALFSIVENVIRNASKHGNWQEKGKLKITFDVYRALDYHIAASDEDNLEGELSLRQVLKRYYASAADGSSLYFITLTDNLDTTYPHLQRLREALREDYIRENGQMVETSKGIKEMRICASWLRGFREIGEEYTPIQFGEHDSEWMSEDEPWYNPAPALYARLSRAKDSAKDCGHLQYIFAVRIPIRVLVVSPRFNEERYKQLNDSFLEPHFWVGTTPESFLEKWTGRNYDFMLLDGESEDLYRTIRVRSSSRLFLTTQIPDVFQLLEERQVEQLDYIYEQLWQKLSLYNGEKISIVDDKAGKTNFIGDGKSEDMSQFLSVGENVRMGEYIYRKHYESYHEFKGLEQYLRILDIRPVFVEGISGGNSTDRIVRCEPLDKVWFFKNLHVMKERIAIFDERIFNMVYGLNASIVLSAKDEKIPCKDYRGLLFARKGVSIFTFVKVSDDSFAMYGLYRGQNEISKGNEPVCYCRRIAMIAKGSYVPVFLKGDGDQMKYDRISIHQGLLDKLYAVFDIKKDNTEEKEKLTKALYQTFMKEDDSFQIMDSKHEFLPGMTIHSGRSRPSEEDMPQRIPFIQYASLEHAVQDCKYSLVDLLDSAFYD